MSNKKIDPRDQITMNMTGNVFMNSTTKFSGIGKLNANQAVDQRLKQRALEAIQSKSPQNKKLQTVKISQLGSSSLFKGLDKLPERISKSPGNQQRLQRSVNHSSLSPQQRRYQTLQNNTKKQQQVVIKIQQNPQKKPIQRQHNRIVENQVNTSRYRGETQVQGNIVSQNLLRNQKSTKDDFSIGDRSGDKRRKYSNANENSLNPQSDAKINNRNTTQSRAVQKSKQKKVTFSPEKPKQKIIQKKQPIQAKSTFQVKNNIKNNNSKQQAYVYVPPQRKTLVKQEINQQNRPSLPKSEPKSVPIEVKTLPYRSVSPPKKQQIKKPEVKIQIITVKQQIRQVEPIKPIPKAEMIKPIQQSPLKNSPVYTYQAPQKKETPLSPDRSQEKVISSQKISSEKKKQTTPKKVHIAQNKAQVQKPAPRQIASYSSIVVVQENITARKVTNITVVNKNSMSKSNVSLENSLRDKSPNKDQRNFILSARKLNVSAQELKKDWSKIKETLKYQKSLSPSNSNKKNIPERQDVAMKMLAQIFLNASTRYSPGLSALIKKGIATHEQIQAIRSKSSQFKINVIGTQKKSPSKPQPKSQRKLNWKEASPEKVQDKQNNRVYQGDVTATQYRMKKEEKSQQVIQQKPKISNIVTENLEKNNRKITRDDFLINKNKQASQKSNSIRESPDIYKRQTSQRDMQDSKKQVAKMKSQVGRNQGGQTYSPSKNNSNYVYQPPAKKTQINPSVQQTPKAPSIVTKPLQIIKPRPLAQKLPAKQQKPIQGPRQLINSKSSTSIIQENVKKQVTTPNIKKTVPQTDAAVQKKNVSINYGQNTSKTSQTKPKQENKPKYTENIVSNKNINQSKTQETKVFIKKLPYPQQNKNEDQKNQIIATSKSQTSIWGQPDIKKGIEKNAGTSPRNQAANSPSGYVYQPPSKKQLSSVSPQVNQTTKNQGNISLRTVQSDKNIRPSVSNMPVKQKPQQQNMTNKQQKIITITADQAKQNKIVKQSQVSKSSIKQAKQASALSKRFCTIITLIIKKRLSSNLLWSIQRLKLNNQRKSQLQKQTSFLLRSLITFSHNYEKLLKRSAFKKVKTLVLNSINKIAKQNKPVQQSSSFSSGRKESATRIIFLFLKNKISTSFRPFRMSYLNIKNKGKTHEQVLDAINRVINKRAFLQTKDSFKKIRTYKNQRQAVLKSFASALSKIKYTAVCEHFSTFVKKDVNQLGSQAKSSNFSTKNGKNIINASKAPIINALASSKSQQVLPTYNKGQQNLGNMKFSANQEAKIQTKRKQFQKKVTDLESKKQSLQQSINELNKDKRNKTKKNSDLKAKFSQIQQQMVSEQADSSLKTSKSKENTLNEDDLVPILTRIYAQLFQDESNQISIERFLSDNQHSLQLPTNPTLLNEWKVLMKNAQLKGWIKRYEGQQPRQKKINQIVNEQNQLMGRLLRSFIRERYIWEWVNIVAHQ